MIDNEFKCDDIVNFKTLIGEMRGVIVKYDVSKNSYRINAFCNNVTYTNISSDVIRNDRDDNLRKLLVEEI